MFSALQVCFLLAHTEINQKAKVDQLNWSNDDAALYGAKILLAATTQSAF